MTASVPANAALDIGSNGNTAASGSITSDRTVPTLTISPNGTTSSANTVTFTFQFSEVVTGFATGDVTVTNGSKGTFTAVDGDTYALAVTPTVEGTVTVDVPANAAVDGASNNSTSASASITSDHTGPSFTSGTTANVAENTTSVLTVTATDISTPVTFALNGGADASKFAITSGGVLTFAAAPNRESPTDAGADNVYNVTVKGTDSLGNVSN